MDAYLYADTEAFCKGPKHGNTAHNKSNLYPTELKLSICHMTRIHKQPEMCTVSSSCQFPLFWITFCFSHPLPTKLGNTLAANTAMQQTGSKAGLSNQ